MEKMKVSLVITVLNEEESIGPLLHSIDEQTKKPDEVIIVDGGSTDATRTIISKNVHVRLFKKKTNRAEGKNYAIAKAKNETIAITDGGCTLHKDWLKEVSKPFANESVEVVSGYYAANARTVFEQCVAVYTLVPADRVKAFEFLPSTRSMAIKKSTWKEAGGFPKEFPLNDDYVFAHRLKKLGKRFHLAKKAIVYWNPREDLKKAFLMFYYFAKGDAQAGIFRPKVMFIFFRYLLGLVLLMSFFATQNYAIHNTIYIIPILYILWAIVKNYRYVKHWKAFLYLPLLQFTSDIAVMAGTLRGITKGNV